MSAKQARDLGIERIRRSTRYLAIGALVAGGILSATVAKALPGHSNRSTTSGSVPSSSSQSSSSQSSGSQSSSGLNAPVQAPQPSYSAPVASSGGS